MASKPDKSDMSNAAKRALRKRKLHESLESGSVTFGAAHSQPVVWARNPKHLGKRLAPEDENVVSLGTPWPVSIAQVGDHFNQAGVEMADIATVDIKHSPNSPTGFSLMIKTSSSRY